MFISVILVDNFLVVITVWFCFQGDDGLKNEFGRVVNLNFAFWNLLEFLFFNIFNPRLAESPDVEP